MRFTLDIKLGNEAMQRDEDVADALHRVANDIVNTGAGNLIIRDLNGNTVGRCKFEDDR